MHINIWKTVWTPCALKQGKASKLQLIKEQISMSRVDQIKHKPCFYYESKGLREHITWFLGPSNHKRLSGHGYEYIIKPKDNKEQQVI